MTELTEAQIAEIVGPRRDWAVLAERRRCIGILLRAIGEYRLLRRTEVVVSLERLATMMEFPEAKV